MLREHVAARPEIGRLGCQVGGRVVQEVTLSAEGAARFRLGAEDVLQHRTQLLREGLTRAARPLSVTA